MQEHLGKAVLVVRSILLHELFITVVRRLIKNCYIHDINIFDNTNYFLRVACMPIYVDRMNIRMAVVIYAVVCINTELKLKGPGRTLATPLCGLLQIAL